MKLKLFSLYLGLLTFIACGYFSKTEQLEVKSVPIPLTLKEAQAKEKAPHIKVTVERKTEKSGGGGSCHHVAVCLLVGTVLLFDKIFPKKYDEVIIEKDEKISFKGTFDLSGNLIQGRAYSGNSFKDYFRLRLKKLGQDAVVQVTEGKLENGKESEKKSVSILSQVDLLSSYQKKLAEYEGKAQKRGKLINEAMAFLGKESLPFVTERLTDPNEMSQTKGMIVETICTHRNVFPESLIKKTLPQPGPHVAKEALFCFLNQKKPLAELTPFIPDMVQGICTGEIDTRKKGILVENVFREGIRTLANLHTRLIKLSIEDEKELRQIMGKEFNKCSPTPMATIGKITFDQKVTVEELVEALKDNQTGSWLTRRLSLDKPNYKEAFIQVLGSAGPGARENLLKKLKSYCTAEEIETIRSTLEEKGTVTSQLLNCL